MHVLRIWLTSGTQIELLYRGKGDIRTAEQVLKAGTVAAHLSDDFGKHQTIRIDQIAGWQCSDYAAELEGALEIARAKQLATEKHQREVAARHGVIGQSGPQMMPANGRIITG
jgi:hypothetical protein